MSSTVPEYFSAHSVSSLTGSTSCVVIRTALPDRLTLPLSTKRTLSSETSAFKSFPAPFSCMLELREITRSVRICERSVMISSVRPSLKYSLSGSALRFSKGSTTIDGLSPAVSCVGRDEAAVVCGAR